MINLRRLHILRVLNECGTVTAAARSLHLTPSSVSQQLRQLSDELGVPLLKPQGRRVQLTTAAHILLTYADELATWWERAQAELQTHADVVTGPLRLCGFPTAVAALLAPTAARLRQSHAYLALHLTEAEPAKCFELILAGEADIAVVIATPETPAPSNARFDLEVLLDEPEDLLVPADHALAGRTTVTLSEASHEPWIAGLPGSDYHQLVMVACAAAGFRPNIAHLGHEWTAVSALVANGLGIALIPRLAHVPEAHAVVRIPLSGDFVPFRRLLTCVRRGSRANPAIQCGLDALREHIAAL